MQNVYDIRKKRGLFFILPDEVKAVNDQKDFSCAVIMFLYYDESLSRYLSYIDNIVPTIDIYIVSNNTEIYMKILQYIKKSQKRIKLVKSKNRGRDVGALLIACKDILQKYEYICFVHDKKRKDYISKEAFDLWIDNLWGNTLGSKNYILNVLNLLDSNKRIGLLVPPEPIGRFSPFLYGGDLWGEDYELTRQLARELGLNCKINKEKPPITLGMCFWTKSFALSKLFKKEWKYENFDDEPLKDDGAINHAVERILGYVAQDAGYLTGTVMRVCYAEKMIAIIQGQIFSMYLLLKKAYGITNLENFLEKKTQIQKFCKKNKQVYLYGAGKIGRNCLQFMYAIECEPTGFLVTKKGECNERIGGIPVESIYDIENIEEVGIIITVNVSLQYEIEAILKEIGNKNYIKY